MADRRRFCRNCGAPINSDAKFCRYCGFRFDDGAKAKKSGAGWLIVLAVILIAVAVFVFPGVLKGILPFFPQQTEVVKVSPENLEASTSSGLSVRLTEYVLDGETELKVEKEKPIQAKNGDYVITPYEVALGDIHEMSDFVEIRIPYDSSFYDAGENPEDCVGGVTYNEATGEWEETLYTVDSKKGEVVILTDHFSKFGAMTIKNKGKRNAYLSAIRTDANGDIPLIDEDKAISVMEQLVESYGEETTIAKLVGDEVLQAAMSLGGAVSTLTDVSGNTFNLSCFLDISDLAMQGKYVEQGLVLFPHHVHYETVSFSNNMFQTYNRGMIDKAGSVLSNVGIAVSGCKLAAMVGKASAGKASDAEILGMYKDAASLAISIGGSSTLGALMGPVWLADQFVNYCFEEGMQIRQDQMAEMYIFFNTKYEGSPELNIRAGRSLKDWRARIIKLIDENPEEDSAKLLQDEVDKFAEDFWKLDALGVDNVAGSAPKNVKRIPFDDAKLRRTLTEEYKKQLYLELYPVMTSVRNYYNNKLLLASQKTVERAKKFYNQKINFSIIEPLEAGEKPKYAGCKVIFAPLNKDADLDSWSSVIPDSGGELYGDFSLIGHISSGTPNTLLVFDKNADITRDDPLLAVPVEIKDFSCKILLEGREDELPDITAYTGNWYDEYGWPEHVKDFGNGVIGHTGYMGLPDYLKWEYAQDPNGKKLILSNPTYEKLDKWESGSVNEFILSEDGQTLIVRYNARDHVVTRQNPAENEVSPDNLFYGSEFTTDPLAPLIPEGDND